MTNANDAQNLLLKPLSYAPLLQVMHLADFGTKGADLGNIFYLRDVTDADAIVAAIPEVKKKSNKASSDVDNLLEFPPIYLGCICFLFSVYCVS